MDRDETAQPTRDYIPDENLREITLIETVTSFLEENGAAEVDPSVLRSLAEALSKQINDTSPGTLQDVTMENSYPGCSNALSSSLGGQLPPRSHGRSVRDLEEQMSTLRKENFNLKLRIFFLEEPGQSRSSPDSDGSNKQLIDAKVEIEMLRKTVREKTELLKDAAQAITRHEEIQQRADIENQALIEQLQLQLQQYEIQLRNPNAKKSETSPDAENSKETKTKMMNLQSLLAEAEITQKAFSLDIEKLQRELKERQESLVVCESKIEELTLKNAELVSQMENQKVPKVINSANDLSTQLADKICELQEAKEQLSDKDRIHEQACRAIQKLMQRLSSQEKEIKRLSDKAENNSNEAVVTTADKSETSEAYQTSSLSELQKQQISSSEESPTDCDKLQDSLGELDNVKALEQNKLLQRKVDVLLKRLNEEKKKSEVVTQLRYDLCVAKSELDSVNNWRMECADVYSILTNRLEELAGFLNSLLKHKDVLGILAADRRHAMRRAVDRSLDLSKSLNLTLNATGTTLADQSLLQLHNLSEILCSGSDEINRTYNSHEELHGAAVANPTIESLKAENMALKNELDKRRSTDGQTVRKERRSLPLPPSHQQFDNQSESEAWSEPDRKVSLARMGLDEASNSFPSDKPQKQLSESDSAGKQGRSMKQDRSSRNSERIAHLEQLIAQRDERILAVQCQLVDLDNRYKQEQLRSMEYCQQLGDFQARNEALHADLNAIGNQEHKELIEVRRLFESRTKELEQLQLEHNTLIADGRITDIELQAAQQRICDLQQQCDTELDRHNAKILELQGELTQKLEAQDRLHQESLARDWISLAIYTEQKQQLVELQRQHLDCIQNLEYQQESERELKQTLVDNELTMRALKKQLDESALQASKAVMERTKAYNDKLQLEQRIENLTAEISRMKEEQKQKTKGNRSNNNVVLSGYSSEEVPLALVQAPKAILPTLKSTLVAQQRLDNSSPDLGIESDAGRVSNTELMNVQEALNHPVNVSVPVDGASGESIKEEQPVKHDCTKVDQENAELRRKLIRTKRAFEDTYEKLRLVNKAKAQVEKDIKNQILKTHNVLRNVRSNMENEL